jgi:hypothetical protein
MTETGFRHKIGDAVYELVHPYESNDDPDYVAMWPVVKITEQYVWVRDWRRWRSDRTFRLSREQLEATGRAWSRTASAGLYARPLPEWPLLVVDVRKPEALAIAGGSRPCTP